MDTNVSISSKSAHRVAREALLNLFFIVCGFGKYTRDSSLTVKLPMYNKRRVHRFFDRFVCELNFTRQEAAVSGKQRDRMVKKARFLIASLALVITVGIFFLGCSDSNLPQSMGADSSGATSIVEGYIIYEHIDIVGCTGTAVLKNVDAGNVGRSTGILFGTEPGVPTYPPDTLNPIARDRYSYFRFEVESGKYAFDISAAFAIRSPQLTTVDSWSLEAGPEGDIVVGANAVVILPFWKISGNS